MKIILMVIGKTTATYLREGIDEYSKRINRYMPFEIKILPDVKTTKKLTEEQQKDAEGKMMLNKLDGSDFVVLLDEHGAERTSHEFSDYLARKAHTVAKQLVFIVGGPYGFSPEVYKRANEKLSLSKMTFPHEMVRLFFVEQIYRAMTIQRGEPYHHD